MADQLCWFNFFYTKPQYLHAYISNDNSYEKLSERCRASTSERVPHPRVKNQRIYNCQ
jgi:hypothetical protein